ncbi:MAG: M15 family metallopeptidase [Euzebya sp.]
MTALRGQDEKGSAYPAFLILTLVTVLIGVFFFQTGRATDLGAEAQTGSDAAALAGAGDIRSQILEWIYSGAWNGSPFIVNVPRATAAAQRYAATNDVVITDFRITTVGYLSYDVYVKAATTRRLTPEGYVSENSTGGERDEVRFGNNERAFQDATARVRLGSTSFLSGGFYTPGGGSGGFGPGAGGGASTAGGGCPVSAAERADLADKAGVSEEFADSSYLSRYAGCDGGVSIRALDEKMKISLLRLEKAMGTPLLLNSAYRSPAYQAQLCQRVSGPCAAPGQSMHNVGLAVDVGNWQIAAAHAGDPGVGLCQPLPNNDAVHLSHSSGRECGGSTGSAGGGGFLPFGGVAQLSAQASVEVLLVK